MTDVYNDITNNPVLAAPGNDAFEKMYLAIREKERRVYNDQELALLPFIPGDHLHYKEWLVRRRSMNRLFNYLLKKKKPLSILEVGCGNGWLIANMAAIPFSDATGIDICKAELEQASRVFIKKNNLVFLQTDLDQKNLAYKKFDVIIFAASIQYFRSLEDIISKSLSFLKEGGEIHILDTFFYERSKIDAAKQRAYDYCRSLGYEEMVSNYFHHCIDSIKRFDHKILFDPSGFKNKLFMTRDPFPWISITAK